MLINLQAAPGRRRRMAELADGVLLSRSGMTRLVDRLEREGLLERDACTDPTAAAPIAVLTDKGEALPRRAPAARTSTACASASSSTSSADELAQLATHLGAGPAGRRRS